jgi:hypothetical protein
MTSSNPNSNPNANANTGPTFRPFAVNRKGSVKFIPANSVGLSKPSISQATQTGGDQIQVTWGDGGGNTYRLQVSTNGGTSFSDVTTTSGLSFTHTGLSFPGSYTYRVRAELGGDVSDYSDNVTETMVDVPSAPGSLAVTGATTSSISLSWNDTANESSYLVEVSPDGLGSWTTAGTTGQNVTTFTHSGLAESVQRYYRVYAVNKAGSGLASSSDNSWTVPATPTGLTATATSSTQINLSWTDVSTGNTSYKVERSTDNTNWTEIATGLSASATTYSATSLSGSTLYYFRVRAANAARNSAYSGTASATTTASTTVPSAPSGFTTTSSFADSVSLSWTDNSSGTGQETGFDIEVSTNAGSTYSSVTTTAANAVSYSHTGRLESTAYLYRIRATNSAGSSSWVVASSVTTPAAVQSFTATAASSTQINLSWTDKSGVETGFRIERSTDNTNWSLVTTTAASATSFSNTSLNASTLYYYRIRSNSYNGTNDSAWYTANATTQAGTYEITYLVIAGGGGGGTGGGGAGGYRAGTLTLTPGSGAKTITIGGGGVGGTSNANGSDSVFDSVTSTGGGKGGQSNGGAGSSGGSGGGGGWSGNPGASSGGSGTSGQGNAGGGNGGFFALPFPSGGGGGAGGAGGSATGNSSFGAGGSGSASSITGSSVTRAVGGSGGVLVGGTDTNGSANTGTGGTRAGSGGSGVVILRMATANYSGTTTGSPTVTTSGSDTILTFNASGSYTA